MMDSQGQFSVSHLLGPTVDVAQYNTLQHPLHGYSGAIAAVSGTQGASPVPSVPSGATITLGYSVPHAPQAAAPPPFNVALAPQVPAHHQIQYYYETAEPLSTQVQVRYSTTTTLTLQPATPHTPPQAQPQPQGNRTDNVTQGHKSQKKKKVPGTERTSAKLSRKCHRNRGEAYMSASGKLVPAKKYVEQDCQCRNQCLSKLGTLADREAVFRRFWDIGDFGRQNAHLAHNVVMVPRDGSVMSKQRTALPVDDRHLRTVRRIYYVKLKEDQAQVRVCKSQFLRLHGVSNGRLDRVLQALHCEHPHALQDRRGQHTPSNKTAQEDVEAVTQHIISLQQQRPGTCGVDLTDEAEKTSVKKMHDLYERWCEEQGRTPVSLWVYRQVKSRLQQSQGVGETGRVTNSLSNKELPIHQAGTTITCQEVQGTQEPQLAPGTTTTTITDIYKHAIISTTTLPKPTITSTITTTTTTTSKPATPDTTNTTSITTSVTTSPATTTTMERRKQRSSGVVASSMTRDERKTRRNKGEAYVTSSGKLRDRKVYLDEPCECRNRCIPSLGTPEIRRQVFSSFWGLGSFTRQNEHIARLVTLAPLSQRRRNATLSRTYSRVYSVQFKAGGELARVCKLAFLRLHGISNGRVDRVLQAVACQSPFALKDRRGRHSPINKTQEEDVSYAFNHMCSFPLVEAGIDPGPDPDHGCNPGPGQPSGCCLPQDLSVEKMYRLYRDQCFLEGRKPVGSFVYRKILKERFHCQVKVKMPYNKTPESDLEFARQHIQSSKVIAAVRGGGKGSLVRGLHQEYVKRCTQEQRRPVKIDVFRKLCRTRLQTKADL